MDLIFNIVLAFIAGYWGLETLGYSVSSSGLWLILSIPLLLFAAIGAFNVYDILGGGDERRLARSIDEYYETKDDDENSDE